MEGTTPSPDAAPPQGAAPPTEGTAPPIAPPSASAPAPAYGAHPPTPVPAPEPRKRSGCRACLLGCLGALALFALTVLVVVGWFLNWPAQWGLVDTPAEKMFSASPDPYAGEALTAELGSQGVTMTGITVYVMPSQESTGQIAYFLIEDTEGAEWKDETYKSPAEGLLMYAAASQAAVDFDIVRIAVDHRDADGLQIATLTAPVDALRAYGNSEISQEELFDQMNGYMDMAGYLETMQE